MLSIKSLGKCRQWHVGDGPVDLGEGAVVELIVDGHELRWLEVALEKGRMEADKDYYREVWGVEK